MATTEIAPCKPGELACIRVTDSIPDYEPDNNMSLHILPALARAEDICVNALLTTRERLRSPRYGLERVSSQRWRELAVADLALEAALSPNITDAQANTLFDEAGDQLEQIVDNDAQFFETFAQAALLETYMPAFTARRKGAQPSPGDIGRMRRSVSDLTYTL